MIAGGATSDGYAQSGYLRRNGDSTVYMFAEFSQCSTCAFTRKVVGSPSGSPRYDEIYNFSTGQIQMYVNDDSQLLLNTSFDPAISWSAPWMPEWEGEVHAQGDDMPGSTSAPTSSTSTRYGYAWDTVNSGFHIWTK